jgi:hypothetical protein
MDDICRGTKVMLSKYKLRVRKWFGTQIVQIRFQIPYSIVLLQRVRLAKHVCLLSTA